MARVLNPIAIPAAVTVTVSGQTVAVKGSKGELHHDVHPAVEIHQDGDAMRFSPRVEGKPTIALVGTTRAVVNNMLTGVSEGFSKKLELVGVGYRAAAKGSLLNLSLGFSHPIDYQMPDGVSVETPTQTEVVISGVDKQKVGQVAAEVRAFRPPEPYKGKGVKYAGERIIRKEAKKK